MRNSSEVLRAASVPKVIASARWSHPWLVARGGFAHRREPVTVPQSPFATSVEEATSERSIGREGGT